MATYTAGTTATTNQPFISSAGFIGTNFVTTAWATPLSPNGNYYYYVTGMSGYARTNTGSGNIYMQISSSISTTAYSVGTARGEANAVSTTYGTITGNNINTVLRDGTTFYGGYYTGGANGVKATRTTGDTGFNVETTTGGTAFTSSSVYFRITYVGMPDSSYAGLSASSGGQTSINLSWNAISGASGYEVLYGTTSSPTTLYTTTSATSATVSGLSPGTTYYFRISAYISGAYAINTAYKGPYSENASATTAPSISAPTVSSSTLTSGRVGQYYSTNVFPSGGGAASSVTASGLPSGLTYTDYGSYVNIYGTPTVSGTYSPTVTASNAGGSNSASQTLPIYSPFPPSADSNSFASATLGVGYSGSVSFSNTLSANGINLNQSTIAGMSVTATTNSVSVSGTPTSSGTFNVTGTAFGTPDGGAPNTTNFSLSIYVAPNNPSWPSKTWTTGRVGVSYSDSITATSATSVTASISPSAGLNATTSGSTVTVSGTPTTSGTYALSLTANGVTGSTPASTTQYITIAAPLVPSASGSAFANGTINVAYGSSTISFSNTLSVTGAPATLAGLSVNASSSGVTLSGTPTSSGTYYLNLTLVGTTNGGAANNTNVQLSVYIIATDPTWPTYTYPDGKVAANYSASVTATQALSVSATISPSGSGLTATGSGATLTVSGVPTTSGTYTVSATATGNAGSTPATFNKSLYIAPLVPPVWVDTSLSSAFTVGADYATTSAGNNSVSATGATSFSVISGVLPPGLTGATAAGVYTITGTPTTRGAYPFTLRATNADGSATPDQLYSAVVAHPPTWIDQTLGDISQGRAYSDSVSVSTSTNVTWTVLDFPAGLTYTASGTNNSVLTISGTTNTTGTFALTVRATNADGYIEKSFNLTLKLPPNWTDNQLGSFVQGIEYYDAVIATNTPTYEIVAGGTLPTGITLNTSTGAFTGTPTVLDEAYSFTVRAYNAEGSVTQAFSGTVQPDLGGGIKVYNGTNWTTLGNQSVYVYDGTTWVEGKTYIWNGFLWVKSLF